MFWAVGDAAVGDVITDVTILESGFVSESCFGPEKNVDKNLSSTWRLSKIGNCSFVGKTVFSSNSKSSKIESTFSVFEGRFSSSESEVKELKQEPEMIKVMIVIYKIRRLKNFIHLNTDWSGISLGFLGPEPWMNEWMKCLLSLARILLSMTMQLEWWHFYKIKVDIYTLVS